jgi:hypothetical protein
LYGKAGRSSRRQRSNPRIAMSHQRAQKKSIPRQTGRMHYNLSLQSPFSDPNDSRSLGYSIGIRIANLSSTWMLIAQISGTALLTGTVLYEERRRRVRRHITAKARSLRLSSSVHINHVCETSGQNPINKLAAGIW